MKYLNLFWVSSGSHNTLLAFGVKSVVVRFNVFVDNVRNGVKKQTVRRSLSRLNGVKGVKLGRYSAAGHLSQ